MNGICDILLGFSLLVFCVNFCIDIYQEHWPIVLFTGVVVLSGVGIKLVMVAQSLKRYSLSFSIFKNNLQEIAITCITEV